MTVRKAGPLSSSVGSRQQTKLVVELAIWTLADHLVSWHWQLDTEIFVLTTGNELDVTVGIRLHLDCPVMYSLTSEVPG